MMIPDIISVINESSINSYKRCYLIKKYSNRDDFEIIVGCVDNKEFANKIVNDMNNFINQMQKGNPPIPWDDWDIIIMSLPIDKEYSELGIDSVYAISQKIFPEYTKENIETMMKISDFQYDIIQDYFYYVEETVKIKE